MKLKSLVTNVSAFIMNHLFGMLPLQKKIVASSFGGKKYGDNPQYVLEKVHEIDPSIDIIWVKRKAYNYELPTWVRVIDAEDKLKLFYEYATARVWLDSHHVNQFLNKRKNQTFVETWHGGLGIKKIEFDSPNLSQSSYICNMIQHTANTADVFISNSDFLSSVYKSAFHYNGLIWKCGYPKTDILLNSDTVALRQKVYDYFKIDSRKKTILYAPTFREWISDPKKIMELYSLDYQQVIDGLKERFHDEWVLLVRIHPNIMNIPGIKIPVSENIIDATAYPEMQELIISSDMLITDYSSCIFDSAVLDKPGLTFATDFADYKAKRGTYYDLDQLPFPYAYNNEQLIENIRMFDEEAYLAKWEAFKTKEVGLYEPGNASERVAKMIIACVNGNKEILHSL